MNDTCSLASKLIDATQVVDEPHTSDFPLLFEQLSAEEETARAIGYNSRELLGQVRKTDLKCLEYFEVELETLARSHNVLEHDQENVLCTHPVSIAFLDHLAKFAKHQCTLVKAITDINTQHGTVRAGTTIRVTMKYGEQWQGIVKGSPHEVSFHKTQIVNHEFRNWTIHEFEQTVVLNTNSEAAYVQQCDASFVGPPGCGSFVIYSQESKFSDLVHALKRCHISQEPSKAYVWLDMFSSRRRVLRDDAGSSECDNLVQDRQNVVLHDTRSLVKSFPRCIVFLDTFYKPQVLCDSFGLFSILFAILEQRQLEFLIRDEQHLDEDLSHNIAIEEMLRVNLRGSDTHDASCMKLVKSVSDEFCKRYNNLVQSQLREYFLNCCTERGLEIVQELELRWVKHSTCFNVLLAKLGIKYRKKIVMDSLELICVLNAIGKVLRENGRFDEAFRVLDSANSFFIHFPETSSRYYNQLHHHTLNNLALVHKDTGCHVNAKQLLEHSLSLLHDGNFVSLATTKNNLGLVFQDLGQYDQAEKLLNEACVIAKKQNENMGLVVSSLVNLSMLHKAKGEYEDAIKYVSDALQLSQQSSIEDPMLVTECRNGLGVLLRDVGKFSEALPLLKGSLEEVQKCLGPYHTLTSVYLDNLAMLDYECGDYENAERLLLEALEIDKLKWGLLHSQTATCMHHLGLVYQRTGRLVEAKELLASSLAVKEREGLQSSAVVVKNNFGILLHQLGEYEDAQKMFDSALHTSQLLSEKPNSGIFNSHNNLCSLLLTMGDYDSAQQHLANAARIAERLYPATHLSVFELKQNQARYHILQQDFQLGLDLLESCVTTSKQVYGISHPAFTVALCSYVQGLRDSGQTDKAAAILRLTGDELKMKDQFCT